MNRAELRRLIVHGNDSGSLERLICGRHRASHGRSCRTASALTVDTDEHFLIVSADHIHALRNEILISSRIAHGYLMNVFTHIRDRIGILLEKNGDHLRNSWRFVLIFRGFLDLEPFPIFQ